MNIKSLLLVLTLLFFSFSAQSQIKNPEDFVDFSYLKLKQKIKTLKQNGWTFLRSNSKVKGKTITDDLYYYKEKDSAKYFLTIRKTFNGDFYTNSVILDINSTKVFLKWKKQMEKEHDFAKDANNKEKYVCLDKEFCGLSYEKRMIKDLLTYRIVSVVF